MRISTSISYFLTRLRQLGWRGTVVLMMKTQLGLGVLSIPAVFDTVGIVPGVILVCVIGGITTWSDYMVGVFKLKHRGVYGVDDVGGMLAGRIGREVLGGSFCLCRYSPFVSCRRGHTQLTLDKTSFSALDLR